MKGIRIPPWAVSFADLALLLLGCFVFLNAMQAPDAPGAAAGEAEGTRIAAAALFEPGEARLTPAGARALEGLARRGRLHIVSRGEGPAASRYDGFELAAARAAATGRALSRKGAAPAEIRVEPAPGEPQHLLISFR